MISGSEKRKTICERLQELGFAREKDIKLYGQELHLISNPIADGDGFSVEGIVRASFHRRQMRIPLSLVTTLKKELERAA
ncbi:MAG: hypothetical protein WBW53_01960 [Terriglobales bacterium]